MSVVDSLDTGAFAHLATDLESDDVARSFALRYATMLDGRVSRIWEALGSGDVENAVDALLSLRSASLTVGATELAGLATGMLGDLQDLDLHLARAKAAHLREATARARRALGAHLGRSI